MVTLTIKLLMIDDDVAEFFDTFFSNAVIDLKIRDFHGAVPLADISHRFSEPY